MADRITKQDIDKVMDLVHVLGPVEMTREPGRSFTTDDHWNVLIGGWSHRVTDEQGSGQRWSRGFMISDCETEIPHRGLQTSKYNKDYEGPGWHRFMAHDILKDLTRMRKAAQPPAKRKR